MSGRSFQTDGLIVGWFWVEPGVAFNDPVGILQLRIFWFYNSNYSIRFKWNGTLAVQLNATIFCNYMNYQTQWLDLKWETALPLITFVIFFLNALCKEVGSKIVYSATKRHIFLSVLIKIEENITSKLTCKNNSINNRNTSYWVAWLRSIYLNLLSCTKIFSEHLNLKHILFLCTAIHLRNGSLDTFISPFYYVVFVHKKI